MIKRRASLEEQLRYCLEITETLSKHPGSSLFLEPITPGPDFPDSYFEKIKKPMDLGTIMTKLNNRKYKNVDDWFDDIELVWKNSISYYGNSSYIAKIARNMLNFTYDLVLDKLPDTDEDWTKYMSQLLSKIKKISKTINSESAVKTNLLNKEEEIRKFIEAYPNLKSPEDTYTITSLFLMYEFPLNTEKEIGTVDLNQVSQELLLAITIYAKERYSQLGLEYPQ